MEKRDKIPSGRIGTLFLEWHEHDTKRSLGELKKSAVFEIETQGIEVPTKIKMLR